jgi:hypothetical protein
LVAFGRTVSTAFGLLGTGENALTFALVYAFQQCPALLHCFLRDVGVVGVRAGALQQARIHLQRASAAAGRDITDVEVRVPGVAHVIVEAKVGLSVPTLDQCVQYLPRLKATGERHRRLVALVESPATGFVERYRAEQPELGNVLVGYLWPDLIPHCVRLQAEHAAATEPGRWVRAFRVFLEEEYRMKCFTEEVWVVPVSTKPLWPGGWSFYDTHVKRRIYYHDNPRYAARRPLYIALRTGGQVAAIQRVLRVEHDALPITYAPEVAGVTAKWPKVPQTIWHLSEPVPLPKAIPTGDAKMRARHVSCDLDVLLSSATVKEAEGKMRLRRRGVLAKGGEDPEGE